MIARGEFPGRNNDRKHERHEGQGNRGESDREKDGGLMEGK